jgi:hypothetical protein
MGRPRHKSETVSKPWGMLAHQHLKPDLWQDKIRVCMSFLTGRMTCILISKAVQGRPGSDPNVSIGMWSWPIVIMRTWVLIILISAVRALRIVTTLKQPSCGPGLFRESKYFWPVPWVSDLGQSSARTGLCRSGKVQQILRMAVYTLLHNIK